MGEGVFVAGLGTEVLSPILKSFAILVEKCITIEDIVYTNVVVDCQIPRRLLLGFISEVYCLRSNDVELLGCTKIGGTKRHDVREEL